MGYDITFHPVAIADLERFVFDVVQPVVSASSKSKRARRPTVRA